MDVPGFILFGSSGGDNHMGCFCFYGSCMGYYMNQLYRYIYIIVVCVYYWLIIIVNGIILF